MMVATRAPLYSAISFCRKLGSLVAQCISCSKENTQDTATYGSKPQRVESYRQYRSIVRLMIPTSSVQNFRLPKLTRTFHRYGISVQHSSWCRGWIKRRKTDYTHTYTQKSDVHLGFKIRVNFDQSRPLQIRALQNSTEFSPFSCWT